VKGPADTGADTRAGDDPGANTAADTARLQRCTRSPKADPSPRIRDAVPADARRIAEIYAHYVGSSVATFEETPPDTVEVAARLHRLSSLGLPWRVIEDAAGVLGYAYAAPFRDLSAYRFTLEDSIYIAAVTACAC
jgi:hypothetical protein